MIDLTAIIRTNRANEARRYPQLGQGARHIGRCSARICGPSVIFDHPGKVPPSGIRVGYAVEKDLSVAS